MSGNFPGRPDHPDFWLISESVIERDAQSESGQNPQEIAGRWIDPESASYAAVQRAALMAQAVPHGLSGTAAKKAIAATAWLDGLLTGMRVQQKKTDPATDEYVLVFTNVNEDGEPYGEHDSLMDAMANLREFPNDSVVVTLRPRQEGG